MAETLDYKVNIDSTNVADQLSMIKNQVDQAMATFSFRSSIPDAQPIMGNMPHMMSGGNAGPSAFSTAMSDAQGDARSFMDSTRLGFHKFMVDAQTLALQTPLGNPPIQADPGQRWMPNFSESAVSNAFKSMTGYGYDQRMSMPSGEYNRRAFENIGHNVPGMVSTMLDVVGLGATATAIGAGALGYGTAAIATMAGAIAVPVDVAALGIGTYMSTFGYDVQPVLNMQAFVRDTSWNTLSGKFSRDDASKIGLEAGRMHRSDIVMGDRLGIGDVERIMKETSDSGGFDFARSAADYTEKLKTKVESVRKVMHLLHQSEQEAITTMNSWDTLGIKSTSQTIASAQNISAQAFAAGYDPKAFTAFGAQSMEMVRGTGVSMQAMYLGSMQALASVKQMARNGSLNEEDVQQLGGFENIASTMSRKGVQWGLSDSGLTFFAAKDSYGKGFNKFGDPLYRLQGAVSQLGDLSSYMEDRGALSDRIKEEGPENLFLYQTGTFLNEYKMRYGNAGVALTKNTFRTFMQETYGEDATSADLRLKTMVNAAFNKDTGRSREADKMNQDRYDAVSAWDSIMDRLGRKTSKALGTEDTAGEWSEGANTVEDAVTGISNWFKKKWTGTEYKRGVWRTGQTSSGDTSVLNVSDDSSVAAFTNKMNASRGTITQAQQDRYQAKAALMGRFGDKARTVAEVKSGLGGDINSGVDTALTMLQDTMSGWGKDAMVTSFYRAGEGRHGTGAAFDFRTRDLSELQKDELLEKAKSLGSNYFVQIEHLGKSNEHLHVESKAAVGGKSAEKPITKEDTLKAEAMVKSWGHAGTGNEVALALTYGSSAKALLDDNNKSKNIETVFTTAGEMALAKKWAPNARTVGELVKENNARNAEKPITKEDTLKAEAMVKSWGLPGTGNEVALALTYGSSAKALLDDNNKNKNIETVFTTSEEMALARKWAPNARTVGDLVKENNARLPQNVKVTARAALSGESYEATLESVAAAAGGEWRGSRNAPALAPGIVPESEQFYAPLTRAEAARMTAKRAAQKEAKDKENYEASATVRALFPEKGGKSTGMQIVEMLDSENPAEIYFQKLKRQEEGKLASMPIGVRIANTLMGGGIDEKALRAAAKEKIADFNNNAGLQSEIATSKLTFFGNVAMGNRTDFGAAAAAALRVDLSTVTDAQVQTWAASPLVLDKVRNSGGLAGQLVANMPNSYVEGKPVEFSIAEAKKRTNDAQTRVDIGSSFKDLLKKFAEGSEYKGDNPGNPKEDLKNELSAKIAENTGDMVVSLRTIANKVAGDKRAGDSGEKRYVL